MYTLSAEHAFGLEEICLCGSFPVGSKWLIIYSYPINTLYCHNFKKQTVTVKIYLHFQNTQLCLGCFYSCICSLGL